MRQGNVGDMSHRRRQSRTLTNTGFAYSPPCFQAQKGAFFCRKEEALQSDPAGRGGPGDGKKGARWGPKPHAQHKCLAPALEEKPELGGRF